MIYLIMYSGISVSENDLFYFKQNDLPWLINFLLKKMYRLNPNVCTFNNLQFTIALLFRHCQLEFVFGIYKMIIIILSCIKSDPVDIAGK